MVQAPGAPWCRYQATDTDRTFVVCDCGSSDQTGEIYGKGSIVHPLRSCFLSFTHTWAEERKLLQKTIFFKNIFPLFPGNPRTDNFGVEFSFKSNSMRRCIRCRLTKNNLLSGQDKPTSATGRNPCAENEKTCERLEDCFFASLSVSCDGNATLDPTCSLEKKERLQTTTESQPLPRRSHNTGSPIFQNLVFDFFVFLPSFRGALSKQCGGGDRIWTNAQTPQLGPPLV